MREIAERFTRLVTIEPLLGPPWRYHRFSSCSCSWWEAWVRRCIGFPQMTNNDTTISPSNQLNLCVRISLGAFGFLYVLLLGSIREMDSNKMRTEFNKILIYLVTFLFFLPFPVPFSSSARLSAFLSP